MRLSLLIAATLILIAAPAADSQGPGAIASTRVSFTIPERRTPPVSRSGHDDRPACSAGLKFATIGTLSVSCLETAAPDVPRAGVVLELVIPGAAGFDTGASTPLAFVLDGGATILLHARPLAGTTPSASAVRATLPAAAFERIVASRSVMVTAHGARHVLEPDEIRALRDVADALRAGIREADSAVARR